MPETRRQFLQRASGVLCASLLPAGAADAFADAAPSEPAGRAPRIKERGAVSVSWATNWEDGMLTGNGRMGAVLYGSPQEPVLVINHNRLYTWEHDPSERVPADTARFVPEIRRLIRDEGYEAALNYSFRMSKENGLAPGEAIDFHPAFFANISFGDSEQPVKYCRSEDFQTGEVETTWASAAGAGFRTRLFASRADNVIAFAVERLDADVSCSVSLPPLGSRLVQSRTDRGANWIGLHNLYAPGNGGYDCVLKVVAPGGLIDIGDSAISVRGTRKALFLIRVDRFRPPQSGGAARLAETLAGLPPAYETLLRSHARIHGRIFNRVRLNVGGASESHLTTDELLARAIKTRQLSPALLEKIYDACRYVILSSSGDLPPNLQGLWNGSWRPPWHSDYSADANLQLAVDSSLSANMPELMDGFFKLVEAGAPSWREGARRLAGCRGILYPARMQDQGTYFQQNRDWQWFNQVSVAGWLGHYFYDYYRYTGDTEFLRQRAVPYLRECALFYEDWYVQDPDGSLRATPSFSFECAAADNATIDFAVAREVLSNLIEGCELLGTDSDGVARWKALLARIPAYMVNSEATTGGAPPPHWNMDGGTPSTADGSLKEFILPNMLEYPHHRHLSSLYPLFVSYEIDPDRTPELWEAAQRLYEIKRDGVHETESHFRMQAALCAARLGRGDDAYELLTAMAAGDVFHKSLAPSHYDNLRVFNVDASGGIPSVIDNCLIFSLPGRLDLLPALPSALKQGGISGILARGRITIDELSWDMSAGSLKARLSTPIKQKIVLLLPPRISEPVVAVNAAVCKLESLHAGKLGCHVELSRGVTVITAKFNVASA